MAEFVMKKMVSELPEPQSSNFEIASAATSTEEIGNPVYPPARRMLAAHGISCDGKSARQITVRDYEYYDYIILMDRNNLRNLRWILPADIYNRESSSHGSAACKKVSLLMDWTGRSRDVADPWYTGDFKATWRDVNEGCRALLEHILK
jgi:protein-tyrosine phosphatase